jgi:hypothetical protein
MESCLYTTEEAPDVFLDYSVIDHLWRLDNGCYVGKHGEALATLRQKATGGELALWMSEISEVEMVQGQHNPKLTSDKQSYVREKDRGKLLIAASMGVRWLTYPCSKLNDGYSITDLSFRTASPSWKEANDLERILEQIPGVSRGDARQIASWLFGSHAEDIDHRPLIPTFLSEDKDLIDALVDVQTTATYPALKLAKVRSVESFLGELSAS